MSATTTQAPRPSGWSREIIRGLVIAAIVAAVWFAYRALPSRHGEVLRINGGLLYFTPKVTREEAELLGAYLERHGYFNGERRTIQLTRDGPTYQVRYAVKPGIESDPEFIELYKFAATDLSHKVFGGLPVEAHLCDTSLRTLRVVTPTN